MWTFILSFAVALVLIALPDEKQQDQNYHFEFPDELVQHPEIPYSERAGIYFDDQPYYYEHLHPAGWSKDGKLAYMAWSNSEMPWHWKIRVLDLDNDKVLFDHSSYSEEPPYVTREQMKAKWYRNSEVFDKKFNEYKIIPDSAFKLEKFPHIFTTDSGEVTYDVRIRKIRDENITADPIITKAYVSVTMKYNNKLYEKNIHSDTLVYAWDFYCEGFIKSPHENRMAVLLKSVIPGQHFSHGNSTVNYIITGSLLDKNFRLIKK